MPEGKWLWDQPMSWHAMNQSLHDIGVLLNYLSELPDSRLLSYFKATQDRITTDGAPTRNTGAALRQLRGVSGAAECDNSGISDRSTSAGITTRTLPSNHRRRRIHRLEP
jgi:hypothetical protein